MKRAFAVIIVVLLAVGMIGLFFASFLGTGQTVSTPSATYTTTPADGTAPTTTTLPQ